MDNTAEIVDALEDLIVGYSEDGSNVAHIALAARRQIHDLAQQLDARDAEIDRLRDLLKKAGVELLVR